MDIIITSSINENGYKSIQMMCGKKKSIITKNRTGDVTTLCINASHKAWKGMGKTFKNWNDAIASYKSSDMKAMIHHAQEVFD